MATEKIFICPLSLSKVCQRSPGFEGLCGKYEERRAGFSIKGKPVCPLVRQLFTRLTGEWGGEKDLTLSDTEVTLRSGRFEIFSIKEGYLRSDVDDWQKKLGL